MLAALPVWASITAVPPYFAGGTAGVEAAVATGELAASAAPTVGEDVETAGPAVGVQPARLVIPVASAAPAPRASKRRRESRLRVRLSQVFSIIAFLSKSVRIDALRQDSIVYTPWSL